MQKKFFLFCTCCLLINKKTSNWKSNKIKKNQRSEMVANIKKKEENF
jgi:hypothetical protein